MRGWYATPKSMILTHPSLVSKLYCPALYADARSFEMGGGGTLTRLYRFGEERKAGAVPSRLSFGRGVNVL